jgi:hypothetical protein
MNRAVTRKEAEEQFWSDVKGLLTGKHGHRNTRADEGIDTYRQVAGQTFPGVVYNQGEEKTAEVIDGLIKTGRPEPQPTPPIVF